MSLSSSPRFGYAGWSSVPGSLGGSHEDEEDEERDREGLNALSSPHSDQLLSIGSPEKSSGTSEVQRRGERDAHLHSLTGDDKDSKVNEMDDEIEGKEEEGKPALSLKECSIPSFEKSESGGLSPIQWSVIDGSMERKPGEEGAGPSPSFSFLQGNEDEIEKEGDKKEKKIGQQGTSRGEDDEGRRRDEKDVQGRSEEKEKRYDDEGHTEEEEEEDEKEELKKERDFWAHLDKPRGSQDRSIGSISLDWSREVPRFPDEVGGGHETSSPVSRHDDEDKGSPLEGENGHRRDSGDVGRGAAVSRLELSHAERKAIEALHRHSVNRSEGILSSDGSLQTVSLSSHRSWHPHEDSGAEKGCGREEEQEEERGEGEGDDDLEKRRAHPSDSLSSESRAAGRLSQGHVGGEPSSVFPPFEGSVFSSREGGKIEESHSGDLGRTFSSQLRKLPLVFRMDDNTSEEGGGGGGGEDTNRSGQFLLPRKSDRGESVSTKPAHRTSSISPTCKYYSLDGSSSSSQRHRMTAGEDSSEENEGKTKESTSGGIQEGSYDFSPHLHEREGHAQTQDREEDPSSKPSSPDSQSEEQEGGGEVKRARRGLATHEDLWASLQGPGGGRAGSLIEPATTGGSKTSHPLLRQKSLAALKGRTGSVDSYPFQHIGAGRAEKEKGAAFFRGGGEAKV